MGMKTIAKLLLAASFASAPLFTSTRGLAAEPQAAERAIDAPPPTASAKAGLENKLSVMAGLTQWVLFRGGNLAVEAKLGRVALEVSHGQGLDLNQVPSLALSSDERSHGAHVYVPWTTGFGVGYRITENLHLMLEAKAHHYEVSGSDRAVSASYTTFSVGPSVFYSIYVYKGLFLQPNVRFWPNIASTLAGNKVSLKQSDGSVYEHQAHAFGLFANVNLGYSF